MFATGKPHPVVNQVIAPLRPAVDDVPDVLASMREHADLFLVHLWHEAAAGVGDALSAEGLQPGDPRPFMVLDLGDDAAQIPIPDGVTIVRVSDGETLAQHRGVDREAFDDPGVISEVFAPESILREPDAGLFVAYLDGEPVATSVGAVTGDVVGIFGVATLDRARRRGIGTAVTDAAIAFGRSRGCDLAYLQATPMGLPVYERMGFDTAGAYRGYVTLPASVE